MVERTQCSKAYEDVAGELSGRCGLKLSWAEDTVVCAKCAFPHHADCWNRQVDCGQFGREQRPSQAPASTMLRPLGPAKLDELRCAHFPLLAPFLYPRGENCFDQV